MGKYTNFFRENYKCGKMKSFNEHKESDGKYVVRGRCACGKGHPDCTWRHVIDEKGNVIQSQETACPCALGSLKGNFSSSPRGIKVGTGIAIGFSILGAIVLIVGIVFLVKHHKKKKATSLADIVNQ